MVNVIDMQDLRYLKLFSKITRVNTRYFFMYNNMLVFFVPKNLVQKSMGEKAKNLKKMSEILKKRIRVVALPNNLKDLKGFIEAIIHPLTFQGLEIKENEIILSAGKMSKAALIGREKRRLKEMQKIIKFFFKKDFKIV